MNIIIVGCGKIGCSIIESLVREGNDVVAIDDDPSVIEEIGNIYDVMCVCGNGADTETLEEAGVAKSDLFVAVTNSDELNMLACFVAEKMGAKHTIARIRKPEYNDKSLDFLSKQLNLTVSVNPEWMAAKELFNILKLPAAVNVENFSGGNLEMVEIRLKQESILDGLSLIELRRKYKAQFLVCAVQRGESVFIPDGNFVLKSGDRIGITATSSEIQKLLKMLNLIQKSAKSVMILGASRIAYYLAKRLINSGSRVVIIDKDARVCETFAEALPDAVVICGDGAEQELLLEEGLESTDAFVALTGMDELNILISIFATTQNVPKVITKVNRNELAAMADKLGLESIVSTKKIVSNVLAGYARAMNNSQGSNSIETLYRLMDGGVEALEFNVSKDFVGLRTPLKDLTLKPNILIAGIIRGRKAIIPGGMDEILPGDRVVVIAAGQQYFDLNDIIQ
ncbi:MAG: Trk system potassium transporter TrkA [Ruminococcaceae bacterium]|nr:Trk system potassium transporter TrkA [Oscillospiraceae bacterium]